VFDKLLLVESVEVRREGSLHHGLHFLGLYLGPVLQVEGFVHLSVRRFAVENLRLVLVDSDYLRHSTFRGADLGNHLVVFLQLLLLLLVESLLVAGLALEGQRVERILRLLLVDNLVILPVGEGFLVLRMLNDRPLLDIQSLSVALRGWHVVPLERLVRRRSKLHPVGVYDFVLFLQVEGVLFRNNHGLLQLIREVLLVL